MTKVRLAADGAPHDGVSHDLAGPEHLAAFEDASEALRRFEVPILVHANNPHERLFVVAFDGTGNNRYSDPDHATNVAKIEYQIREMNRFGQGQVASHYVVGPGTQENRLASLVDNVRGSSYESNIKEAYSELVRQSNVWVREDPEVVIRVQSIGFSRGASQVAGFTRLLHESGIPDLGTEARDSDGRLSYTRNHVEPGKTVQAVGLFDPVATGAPMNFDRRLPSSVVSGFQITSANELRRTFPSDQIIAPGLSKDGRFLNVMVPGAHSDVGGGYLRDGLSTRCGNLMRDYCNGLSDKPYLQREFEPTDARLNVIHKSTEGNLLFRLDPRVGIRGTPTGTNTVLVPRHLHAAGIPSHPPAAVDAQLEAALVRQHVPNPVPNMVSSRPDWSTVGSGAAMESERSTSYAPRVVAAAGVAAFALDAVETDRRRATLEADGNVTGANSVIQHFGARNLGGMAGAEAFAAAGAAVGMESGPGMVVTAGIGGVVGYFGGGKIVDAYDNYRITHQDDGQGNSWRLDAGEGWTREVAHGQRLTADPALAGRLSYQATNTSVELALSREHVPKDPFSQPAAPGESPGVREAPWIRDTQTHQWSRQVVDGLLEHGMVSSHLERATPVRTAELERAAERTTLQNAQESPLGIAQSYRAVYEEQGWSKHGAMPDAVKHALDAPIDKIMASDGHAYSRGSEKEWVTPGMV